MARGCVAAWGWPGWVRPIVLGIAGLAGPFCLVGGWRTLAAYGLALAWVGLAVGLYGALAEWLAFPAFPIADLAGLLRGSGRWLQLRDNPAPRRGPGVAAFVAAGLTALPLGRLIIALA